MLKERERGITLVDLLIIVAILSVLAAIFIPQFVVFNVRTSNAAAESDLRNAVLAQQTLFAASGGGYGVTGLGMYPGPGGTGYGSTLTGPITPGSETLFGGFLSTGPSLISPAAAIGIPVSVDVSLRSDTVSYSGDLAGHGESYILTAKHRLGDTAFAAETDVPDTDFLCTNSTPMWVGMPGLGMVTAPGPTIYPDLAYTMCGGMEVPVWTPVLAPTASAYVIYQDDSSGNSEIVLRRTTDGGQTWTAQQMTGTVGASQNPSVAVSSGNMYAVWQDDTKGNNEIYLKRSQDGGQTWTAQRLTSNIGSSQNPAVVTVADGSAVYVVYQDDVSGDNDIYLKRSVDGGGTWTDHRLTSGTGNSQNPAVALNGSAVYAVWQDDTKGNNEIYLKRSMDGGQTWTAQRLTTTSGSSQNPSVAVNENNVYIAWQESSVVSGNSDIYLRVSQDGGASWTTQRLTSTSGSTRNAAVKANGSVVSVAYEDDMDGSSDIYLKRSEDGGMTWATHRLTSGSGNARYPSVMMSGNHVYVLWQDDTRGNNEIYLKRSMDGGLTWTAWRMTENQGSSQKPRAAY